MKELVVITATIIMILLMGATCILTSILASRRPIPLHKNLRTFNFLLLAYLLFAFLHTYSEFYGIAPIAELILDRLSDVCYFMFIVAWLFIMYELLPDFRPVSRRATVIITAVYGCLAESLVLFSMSHPAAVKILTLINALYVAGVLILALCYLIRGRDNRMILSFSGMLVLYMIWTLFFDFFTVHPDKGILSGPVIIDPLLVICCLLDAALIAFFFKRDPLHLLSEEKPAEEKPDYEAFAESVNLTKREKDVFLLVCNGMSNPDIADDLCISENTVKRHVNNIFHKAGVTGRYELMAAAMKFRP